MKKILISIVICASFLFTVSGCNIKDKANHPKNIVFLIGDGMGLAHIHAGYTVNHGQLNMMRFSHYGYIETQSKSHYVTDSGASGTAMATGTRTYNGAIGVDTDTIPLKTILEYAEDAGLATGLVSTSSITHATPASFIAHRKSRNDYDGIATDFLNTEVDVVIGGGLNNFNKRKDSIDLIPEFTIKGYQFVSSIDDIESIKSGKLLALTAPQHNPKISEGRGNYLPKATQKALELLSQNDHGFFVMIEGSMIDWGAHENNTEYIVEEVIDFDKAVKVALDFAANNPETLVVMTADHETGGLTIMNGSVDEGTVTGGYTTSGHTGIMVPVMAFGPGAERFAGFQKNTDLFEKMMELLKLGDGAKRKK